MTTDEPAMPDLERLLDRLQGWVNNPDRDDDTGERAAVYDLLARAFTHAAGKCGEIAAWCRLGASTARGEDVPMSIHPQPGEDPGDTARWQKWRVS